MKIEQAASGQSMGLARVSNWKMLPRFTPGLPEGRARRRGWHQGRSGLGPCRRDRSSGRLRAGEDREGEGSWPRTSSGKAISQIAARVSLKEPR